MTSLVRNILDFTSFAGTISDFNSNNWLLTIKDDPLIIGTIQSTNIKDVDEINSFFTDASLPGSTIVAFDNLVASYTGTMTDYEVKQTLNSSFTGELLAGSKGGLVSDDNDKAVILTHGDNGDYLVSNDQEETGLKWEKKDFQEVTNVTNDSTNSTSYVDVPLCTLTTIGAGDYFVSYDVQIDLDDKKKMGYLIINVNGSDVVTCEREIKTGDTPHTVSIHTKVTTSGSEIIKMRYKVQSGNIFYNANKSFIIMKC